MLIAVLAIWLSSLFGGGADAAARFLSAARDNVPERVTDRDHRKAAEKVFDRLDELLRDVAKRRDDARDDVSKALSKRNGNARPALESLATDAAAFDVRLVELRFNLRDTLTREEWQAVFPKPNAPVSPK
jgi:hypothetical protein